MSLLLSVGELPFVVAGAAVAVSVVWAVPGWRFSLPVAAAGAAGCPFGWVVCDAILGTVVSMSTRGKMVEKHTSYKRPQCSQSCGNPSLSSCRARPHESPCLSRRPLTFP